MTDLIQHRPQSSTLRLEGYNRIQDKNANSGIKGFVLMGTLTIVLSIGGFGYWAFASKLDGAVVAPASLVVEGNRKTVEHLEGGVVRSILVADGQMVKAGETLVELDSTNLDVNLDVLGSQVGDLTVRRARLLAQLSQEDKFERANVTAVLGVTMPQETWASAYATHRQLFDAERLTTASERALQEQQILGLDQQVAGLAEQRASNARQLEITRKELGNLESLFAKGLVAGARVNARRVEVERLNGVDAALRTQVAEAQNQIRELMLTGLGQQKLRDEAISTELAAVEAQLAALVPQYSGAAERLKSIRITAPVSGRVVGMTVFTKGGVVRPGAPILDIVPEGDALIVEARVNTADIEKLFVGQTTRVRLSAFDQGDVPEATGRIVDISADSLEDDRTGQPYYTARVKLDAEQPQEVAGLELLPGMPADLFVNTGERTALSYLAQPLMARLARTFIE